MKVRALKIAVIYGMAVGIGDELELNEKVAKAYIEKGFVEEVAIVTTQQLSEPKEIDVTMNLVSEQKSDEQAEQKSDEQAGKVKKGK